MDYPFNLKGILYFPKINMEYESIEGTIKLYNNHGAVIMAYVLYKVVYEPEKKMIPQLSKQKFSKQKRIAAHNK